jgi:hypothetical protein
MFTISSAFYDGFAKERFESLFLISNDSAGTKRCVAGNTFSAGYVLNWPFMDYF